jgi:hypothetical protein
MALEAIIKPGTRFSASNEAASVSWQQALAVIVLTAIIALILSWAGV